MKTTFVTGAFLWGTILWLIGYLLGIVLFMIVPPSWIGWIITPIGILLTLWVLRKKFITTSFTNYLSAAVIWSCIAIILDYIFIVKLLMPLDGYYKLDVFIYYATTFALPVIFGWKKLGSTSSHRAPL